MKHAIILLAFAIVCSSCSKGGFFDGNIISENTSTSYCAIDYQGPGDIFELSKGDRYQDRFQSSDMISLDDDRVYFYYPPEKLVTAFSRHTNKVEYMTPVPSSVEHILIGEKINASEGIIWAQTENAIVEIEKQSGIITRQFKIEKDYRNIYKHEKGYLANMIVDCQDVNSFEIDLINSNSGNIDKVYSEILGPHTSTNIIYLGKFGRGSIRDLFLLTKSNSHKKERILLAINIENGKKTWQRVISTDNFYSNQDQRYIIHENLFITSTDDKIKAFDLDNYGAVEYETTIDLSLNGLFAQHKDATIVYHASNQFIQFKAVNGTIIQTANPDIEYRSLKSNYIKTTDDHLFISDFDNGLYIFNMANLEKYIRVDGPTLECKYTHGHFKSKFLVDENELFLSSNYAPFKIKLDQIDFDE